MSEEQFEAILQAIADLQVSIDAIDLRTHRLAERPEDDPQPPAWAGYWTISSRAGSAPLATLTGGGS